ncbi:MAG: hypothetical protein KAT75_04245 [Dehalococcoidia bacterium]|nr:hypothetical protein [Dehalococcoidia bacterium]
MHYFQQRYIREGRTFPALAGLETIDLPNKGLLSGIEIRVWGVPGLTANKPDVWLHDRLKKIEVMVNGSQVVKSYDARQLLAMMLYKRTPHFSHDMKNTQGDACEEYFYINLGRHYHDLEYMLDLSQVNDPELRIEYDFAMTSAAGWTNGDAMTVAPKISVICHLLRDPAVTPKGYIKTSEIYRFDNATLHAENMTVARGPTYSNLYLQSWYKSQGLAAVLDHYEVNINSDDIIPIRTGIQELLAENIRKYGQFTMVQRFVALGNQAYPWPLEAGNFHGEIGPGGTADSDMIFFDLWGNAMPIGFMRVSTGVQAADTHLCCFETLGALPFSVAAIPLFDPWDEDTWIDTSKLGDFWVRVEELAGANAGVMKLLGDEVVTRYVTPSWP